MAGLLQDGLRGGVDLARAAGHGPAEGVERLGRGPVQPVAAPQRQQRGRDAGAGGRQAVGGEVAVGRRRRVVHVAVALARIEVADVAGGAAVGAGVEVGRRAGGREFDRQRQQQVARHAGCGEQRCVGQIDGTRRGRGQREQGQHLQRREQGRRDAAPPARGSFGGHHGAAPERSCRLGGVSASGWSGRRPGCRAGRWRARSPAAPAAPRT